MVRESEYSANFRLVRSDSIVAEYQNWLNGTKSEWLNIQPPISRSDWANNKTSCDYVDCILVPYLLAKKIWDQKEQKPE